MKNQHSNQKRPKPARMSLLAVVALLFLMISCDNNNNGSGGSGQLFREIYNNTSWQDSYGTIYTFSSGRIFNLFYAGDCYYYSSGSFSNVDYDGCVYDSVDNIVIAEDENTLSAKQQTSSSGTGPSCGSGGSAELTFEVLDENTMEVQVSYDGVLDQTIIINKTAFTSTLGCVDGTQSGFLW